VAKISGTKQRSNDMIVNQNSFWAAWQEGMVEPNVFANHADAKEEVAELARNTPGVKAYLYKLEQVGSAVTTDMVLKGRMAEEIDEDE
jgi:hypothetical protein